MHDPVQQQLHPTGSKNVEKRAYFWTEMWEDFEWLPEVYRSVTCIDYYKLQDSSRMGLEIWASVIQKVL